jgi:hypothetical protein
MNQLTFITPVAPYHTALLDRTIASVQAQTVACEHIVMHDSDARGPSWLRNEALLQVTTPFVTFLDADDWIEPNFAEKMLAAWKPGRYVYCDWHQKDEIKAAPDRPWYEGTWHPITTVIPTVCIRDVGGFDETLPAAEDTDAYLRLTCSGLCGIRVQQPLFHYGSEGRRAKQFVQGPQYLPVLRAINKRYHGMACCGDKVSVNQTPAGNEFEGSELAVALWSGNRAELGRATGRMYPRSGNGKLMYVHFSDVDASPHLWQRYVEPAVAPIVNEHNHTNGSEVEFASVEDAAVAMFGEPEIEMVRPAAVQPDVAAVLRLGMEGLG